MPRIANTEPFVQMILIKDEEARKDDFYLYKKVL